MTIVFSINHMSKIDRKPRSHGIVQTLQTSFQPNMKQIKARNLPFISISCHTFHNMVVYPFRINRWVAPKLPCRLRTELPQRCDSQRLRPSLWPCNSQEEEQFVQSLKHEQVTWPWFEARQHGLGSSAIQCINALGSWKASRAWKTRWVGFPQKIPTFWRMQISGTCGDSGALTRSVGRTEGMALSGLMQWCPPTCSPTYATLVDYCCNAVVKHNTIQYMQLHFNTFIQSLQITSPRLATPRPLVLVPLDSQVLAARQLQSIQQEGQNQSWLDKVDQPQLLMIINEDRINQLLTS